MTTSISLSILQVLGELERINFLHGIYLFIQATKSNKLFIQSNHGRSYILTFSKSQEGNKDHAKQKRLQFDYHFPTMCLKSQIQLCVGIWCQITSYSVFITGKFKPRLIRESMVIAIIAKNPTSSKVCDIIGIIFNV